MKNYLILLKGKMELDYSPEQLQQRLEEYRSWISTYEDRFMADNRLERSGAHISKKDKISTDGPFLESKEIIAGFIILKGESQQEIVSIMNGSPLLKYFEVYIRPMVD